MTRTLVLFDIDGTLIHSGRAGVRALARAFEDLFGAGARVEEVPFAGRTDRAIVLDVLALVGHPATDENLLLVRDAYLARLGEEVARPVPHPKCVLPGVLDALAAFDARDDVAVGLLTGNFETGAAIKLGFFDLWRRFEFGAFGDAHVDRRDLVPVAIARAGAAGARVEPAQVVVIGDTPLDVDCAHAGGARAIAVATGPYDVATLEGTGADAVVSDLSTWRAAWERLGLV